MVYVYRSYRDISTHYTSPYTYTPPLPIPYPINSYCKTGYMALELDAGLSEPLKHVVCTLYTPIHSYTLLYTLYSSHTPIHPSHTPIHPSHTPIHPFHTPIHPSPVPHTYTPIPYTYTPIPYTYTPIPCPTHLYTHPLSHTPIHLYTHAPINPPGGRRGTYAGPHSRLQKAELPPKPR